MPFRKGQSGNPATQFSSTSQPETNGRPEGVRNRATVAREVLALARALPDNLISSHPDLDGETTIEEVMALVQAERAINGDTNAYKALMDSAYGAPKQETALSNPDGSALELGFYALLKESSINPADDSAAQ